ncbi:hypothetical protein J3R82DRAFT_4166 [Butyriboletus roseoflavus]|nr:hypothetical protein J3R82DRAFT_4166 [Butyriboletus roseoflavus]
MTLLPSTSHQFLWTRFSNCCNALKHRASPSLVLNQAWICLLCVPSSTKLLLPPLSDISRTTPKSLFLFSNLCHKFSTLFKTTVTGPNAEYTFTSGGRSASLHTLCRLCESLLLLRANYQNWKQDTNSARRATCVHQMQRPTRAGGDLELWDEEPIAAQSGCWIRYTSTFTPDESGDWEIRMNVTWRGKLILDETLVIDLPTNPQEDHSTADRQGLAQGQRIQARSKAEQSGIPG